jgi:hypothetical protein
MSGPLIVPLLTPGESPGDGTKLYIISIVMVIISGFVVLARIATVVTRRVDLGLDDYCICVALVYYNILLDDLTNNSRSYGVYY